MAVAINIVFVLLILECSFQMISARSSIYPSIYWNPWNPLFACEAPTINVRIGDTINFLCPSDEYNFYIPNSHVNPIYENLYFLDNNEQSYKSCNATGARRLLRCDDKKATPKLYTISFRDIQTSERSMKFERGQTYYLIGTGFRKTDQLDNLVGGSCLNSDARQFKLRLKIHVCLKDDECNVCESAGCYYQKCGETCTKWETVKSTNSPECEEWMSRNCTNPYLSNVRTEHEKRTDFNWSACADNITNKGKQLGPQKTEGSVSYEIVIIIGICAFGLLVCLLWLRCSRQIKKHLCQIGCHQTEKCEEKNLEENGIDIPERACLNKPSAKSDNSDNSVFEDFFKEIKNNTVDKKERDAAEEILALIKGTQIESNEENEIKKERKIIKFLQYPLKKRSEGTLKTITDVLINHLISNSFYGGERNIGRKSESSSEGLNGAANNGYRKSFPTLPKKTSCEEV